MEIAWGDQNANPTLISRELEMNTHSLYLHSLRPHCFSYTYPNAELLWDQKTFNLCSNLDNLLPNLGNCKLVLRELRKSLVENNVVIALDFYLYFPFSKLFYIFSGWEFTFCSQRVHCHSRQWWIVFAQGYLNVDVRVNLAACPQSHS